MFTIQLVFSGILILCGYLVKVFPNLIAGYNSLSDDEKNRIDVPKLSGFLRKVLVWSGIFTLMNYLILDYFNIQIALIFSINSGLTLLLLIFSAIYSKSNFLR